LASRYNPRQEARHSDDPRQEARPSDVKFEEKKWQKIYMSQPGLEPASFHVANAHHTKPRKHDEVDAPHKCLSTDW